MIVFVCPGCRHTLPVPAEMAGRAMKCPACGRLGEVGLQGELSSARSAGLPVEAERQVMRVCDRFEKAWQEALEGGQAPSLEDHLAGAEGAVRAALRQELQRLDVEYRGKAKQPLPAQVGHCQLGAELGKGGMGQVFQAQDTGLNRPLAVKFLLAEHRNNPELQHRFLEEARIMGQLQHPGVVPIHELGQLSDGRPYFTMKLIDGHTLAELLRERPNPEHERARYLAMFEQVCQTIAYAHSQGVIHRDLKPANVMVGAFGEVQVMDWGLAKVLASRERQRPEQATHEQTQAGQVLGTPAFMAPEQARGEVDDLDARADVFGLGAVLCHILTGQPPFTGPEARRLAAQGDLTDAFSRLDRCGADAELVTLCKECLAPERAARPANAQVVAERVAAHRAQVQERLRLAEMARVRAEARRRLAVALAATVLLLVLAGGSGAWWWQQQRASARARQRETGEKALVALEHARALSKEGWQANDVRKLNGARAEADRAAAMADLGASPAVRQEVAAFQQELAGQLTQAERTQALLTALLDVSSAREEGLARDERAGRMVLSRLSADEQYAAAFRTWGLDVDRTEDAEVVKRLRQGPDVVLQEIIAALDGWGLERRRDKRPEAEWRRLFRLAAQVDSSEARARLRDLLTQPPSSDRRKRSRQVEQLAELSAQMSLASEPVLTVVLLSRAFDNLGDRARAESVLRQALLARPNQVVLLDELGRLLERQGPARLGEAIECFRAARALRPDLGIALARALSAVGRAEEGEGIVRELLRQRPNHPERYLYLGHALFEQKKWGEAEKAYRRAISLQPANPQAYANLGAALGEQKKLPEAVKALRKAVQLRPDFAQAYANLGAALGEQNKMAEAAKACRRAIQLQPDLAMAYLNLGAALHVPRNEEAAVKAYRKAIELQPNLASAYYNLGNALRDLKQLEEAVKAYRKAIEIRPDYADAYDNLGVALLDLKQTDEALEAHRKAIEIKPDFALAHLNLGGALYALKQVAEAEKSYRKALELQPNFPQAYYNLGIVLRRQKRVEEAVNAYRKAIELLPNYPEAYNNLGNALHQLKQLDEAARAFRMAIEYQPDNAFAYHNLGAVLLDLKQVAEAVKAFRKANELLPDHPVIRANLRRAERELSREGPR